MKDNWKIIDSFTRRLYKIGIEVELSANFPWIYLDSVNGIRVTGSFQSKKEFTAFWGPVKFNDKAKFTDMREVFKKIREMVELEDKETC